MRLVLLLPLLFFFFTSTAQVAGKNAEKMDHMPEFPGGIPGIQDYLSKNTVYPEAARQANIEGKVMVKFVVGIDGSVTDVTVINHVDSLLDNEAVRVIRNMPKWKPGVNNGKKVKVYYTIPVAFKLEDPKPDVD